MEHLRETPRMRFWLTKRTDEKRGEYIGHQIEESGESKEYHMKNVNGKHFIMKADYWKRAIVEYDGLSI